MTRGLRAPDVAAQAGITYRQLDYWLTTGLLDLPDACPGGTGYHRRFTPDEADVITTAARLYRAGLTARAACQTAVRIGNARAVGVPVRPIAMHGHGIRLGQGVLVIVGPEARP